MTTTPRTIEAILKAVGPCLSTRVAAEMEKDGLSDQAARQRVSRLGAGIGRLHSLPFPRRAKFVFLESQQGSRAYWEALIRDIQEASPAYAAAIAGMVARGGVVPTAHFPIVCGSPIRQSGHMSAATVYQRLSDADLLHLVEVPGVGDCVSLTDALFLRAAEDATLRARLVTEGILLTAVKDWARKLGAASYGKIQTRDETVLPQVGTFAWDLAGPSYLRPMVRRTADGKPKPGFLVCDVALGDPLTEAAVAAFVRKCTTLGGLKKLAPVWPVLVAERFSREALRLGRSHGVMMATPELLFGSEVGEALSKLLHTLSKAAAVAVEKPEIIDELFKSLGKIEGAAGNLRGALFEMIVGHLVAKLDFGNIDIGRKIFDGRSGERAEIDVLRVKEYLEVWTYECKGYQPTSLISLDEVETWLIKVGRIHSSLSAEERFQGCAFHHEYWTCGGFSAEALQRLERARAETKRYAIGWKNGPEVRKYAARLKPKAVLQMLDDHYFKHPIARIDQRYDGPAEPVGFAVSEPLGELEPV